MTMADCCDRVDIIFIMKKSADAGVYAGKESGTESAGTGAGCRRRG